MLTKQGKRILQIDKNSQYALDQSTFSLRQLLLEVEKEAPFCEDNGGNFQDGDIRNLKVSVTDCEQDRLFVMENSKQFHFDFGVKLLHAGASMIKTLIDSGISLYLDFCLVKEIYFTKCTSSKEAPMNWNRFPLSKECIFMDKNISLLEKRSAMKFIGSTSAELFMENYNLLSVYLKRAVNTVVLQSCGPVAQLSRSDLLRLETFVRGCGVFGSTPYLYSINGSGDLLQGFIRMSAVNGATQILNSTFGCTQQSSEPFFFSYRISDTSCFYTKRTLVKQRMAVDHNTLYKRIIIVKGSPLIPCDEDAQISIGYHEHENCLTNEQCTLKVLQRGYTSSARSSDACKRNDLVL